ncbi:mitochondrial import receptor subunit tom-20 [Aaosphaeria arxii CBS 175.79]|uniref:Mitochondrial import receptor subunit TOM20 n=1 Tax=Aaosphaeria arxii CBS 175.79 TaxID=1450172 RepID=A0A6A5XAT0_9PLEO|nr:mitochondrial import receptor subunit tom-20 [Aaosphaeria arxii CBS 175.79]KAF2010072.1 mitochondrial import receptor subunit tom-20 [Aaosphaeria arxii CBS 175.79]
MSQQSIRPATIAAISVGTVVTGLLAYAIWFDHRRRNDPDFRKQLKRESKRTARVAKEEAESAGKEQKKAIREAVEKANEEGFPKDPEEVEAYFMQEVAQGEGLCQQGADNIDAALCFYRALKVYPNPRELINIYDKTVPKPVLDILAEMIAVDTSIPVGSKEASDADADSSTGGGIDE